MSLRVGDIGKIVRVATGFNLSGNSELTMEFDKPDGTTTLTKLKADGVTAPSAEVNDPTLGILAADTYLEYPTASGDIDQDGQWVVHAEYDDATPKHFCGDRATFSVLPC